MTDHIPPGTKPTGASKELLLPALLVAVEKWRKLNQPAYYSTNQALRDAWDAYDRAPLEVAWRGYCECKWDHTRSRIVELHPACRLHAGPASETFADIRDELRELREIANVSTPQLCIAIREVVQRIEDAAHPANAPPYRPTFGDSASPEWRQANERTKHHVSGCDCRDCQTVRGTSKSTHEQCTCGESMAKWGDDLCRCKMFDEVRPALKAKPTPSILEQWNAEVEHFKKHGGEMPNDPE